MALTLTMNKNGKSLSILKRLIYAQGIINAAFPFI
ncbi:hypothetical protein PSBY109024_03340 [Pseudoalteromonas byunsanensis]